MGATYNILSELIFSRELCTSKMPNKIQKSINTLIWLTVPVDVDKNTIRQICQTKIVQLIEILQSRKKNIGQLTTWAYLSKGKITVIELTPFNEKLVAGQCYLHTNQPGLQPVLCMNCSSHS